MFNTRFWTLVGIVLVAAAARLLPHPPNFTPIGAMALLGGVYFSRWPAALAVPLGAMLLSDLALGLILYGEAIWPSMPFVYGSFALSVGLGRWVRRCDRVPRASRPCHGVDQTTQARRPRHPAPLSIGGAALAGSIQFFVITNFGFWLRGSLYPKTLEGLAACYLAAIPFFRNTLAGDAVYTLLLFGGLALAQRYWPVLREQPTVERQDLIPSIGP